LPCAALYYLEMRAGRHSSSMPQANEVINSVQGKTTGERQKYSLFVPVTGMSSPCYVCPKMFVPRRPREIGGG